MKESSGLEKKITTSKAQAGPPDLGKTKLNLKSHHDTLGRLHQTKTDFHPCPGHPLPPPVTIPSSLPPRAISPSSPSPELPAPAIAERPSSQPEQNLERWNPSPERRGDHWACSVVSQAGAERLRRARRRVLPRPRPPPPRAGAGVMAAAAAGAPAAEAAAVTRRAPARRRGCGASSRPSRRRRRRLHQQVLGEVRGLAGARPSPPRGCPSPSSAPSPQLPQVAAKFTEAAARDLRARRRLGR